MQQGILLATLWQLKLLPSFIWVFILKNLDEEFVVKVRSFGSFSKGGQRKSILVLDDQI
jgi:hypothetical protein